MAADLSQYRTCAIAIPDSEKNSSVSNEHIIGAIGGTPASSAAHAVVTKLDQLWESGAVSHGSVSFDARSLTYRKTVTYSYVGGTENQQSKVDKVILEW
jgi:hypothetical protein